MSQDALIALLPLLWVGAGSIAVLLQVSVRRSALAGTTLAAGSLILALLSLAMTGAPGQVTALLAVDSASMWYWGVLLLCGLGVVLLLHDYLASREEVLEEAQALVLLATLGGCLVASATHFAMLFLGIELMSIALYALIAYVRRQVRGVEAATKYLVLTASSTAFFLFGAALVHASTGALSLAALAASPVDAPGLLATGGALVLVGFGFKLALVPFHLWTPDVYQGAPAPATALVATVSKGAVAAALARWVLELGLWRSPHFALALGALAAASMLVGNLLALRQDNVKRLLAYSSIAHMGYLLVALVAAGPSAAGAVAFYVAAYVLTTIGAFGVVSLLSAREPQAEALDVYRGLFWRHPLLAALFTIALLSLAGVPLTAGFLGKLLVLGTGVEGAAFGLVLLLVIGSAIGVFYYLRVVAAMFQASDGQAAAVSRSAVGWAPVLLATVAMVGLGVAPEPLLRWLGGW